MDRRLQKAEQFRKAVQFFAQSLSDDAAMEIATVFPAYEVGKAYKVNEMFVYGLNDVGDPQLFRVVQAHTSQSDWKPDETASLYSAIGLNASGYPLYSQPTGAHDAYDKGDIVDYKGKLYESVMDDNVYSPETYPDAWKLL